MTFLSVKSTARIILPAVMVGLLSSCKTEAPPLDSSSSVASAVSAPGNSDDYEVVDCLLPGQIRQLGTMSTYVTERRPVRTTREDCAIRGGEYVAADRADYRSALKIWLGEAEKGSAEAQYYAATIYERGQGGIPDYDQAAKWYRKSADQGDKRAAIGLGRLYEQGLGVAKDPSEASKWFARASGLSESALSGLARTWQPDGQAAKRIEELERAVVGKDQEIKKLSSEVQRVNGDVVVLRLELNDRVAQAQQARAKLQQREQQSDRLQTELTALKGKSEKDPQAVALERRLQILASSMTQDRTRLAERDSEVLQLQGRIKLLEKNAGRIQVLEHTVAAKDRETQALRAKLTAANQNLVQLSSQLAEREQIASDQERKSREIEERYDQARIELEQLRANPDQAAAMTKYEDTIRVLQQDMGQARRETDDRTREVTLLREKIASLEAEAEKQAKALQVASVTDLGFDGPSLEIIDPPTALHRGIQVTTDQTAIAVRINARQSITGRVLAPAGLRTLTVNGVPVTPNADGVFTTSLPALRSGHEDVDVQILAVDIQNKLATLKFSLNSRASGKAAGAADTDFTAFGRYHALVIGNDHYQHWPQLMNAISDATAVAHVLKAHYGFQVTLLTDATRAQIMKALNQYRKILTEKDNLLIYYAGHGHLDQGIDRGYWIPVDAETHDNSEWVLLPGITDMLQLISAKHVMVVADSCFGGKLTRASLAQLKPGLTDEARFDLLKTLAQKRVRTAMTSGGVQPVLDAGGSGHSVFAEAFLGVLEDNGSVLEAERLFWAVRTRVVSTSQKLNAEQIPTYDPIHMAGHESLGDFIFVRHGS
ncbi:hypothetical protein W02_03780 [Nitrospira sp. KM1]|uniref:caspase family protein n=1 Tax=Nitrospira sp. KM1 TaxID=1936990 RepID=UPI0013A7750C|nr:caspase family protein [Nitrospira sp. KM1]BCA53238.1 hypothetical protein W02_03780 [Nitrospira sp. KM1]